MEDSLKSLYEYVSTGNISKVEEIVKNALEKNIPIKNILDDGLLYAMGIIGEEFKENRIFIPEVLIAAKAVHAGLSILEPLFTSENIKHKGEIIIGTVKGDLHDIGKNLVSMMLKGAGFKVFDLGVDVSKEKFLEELKDKNITIVGISCLITTALPNMKSTIEYLRNESFNGGVKIMVGGAAVTKDYAESIGADAYGENASDGVALANNFLKILSTEK